MGGDEQAREEARSFPTLREARYSQSLERGLAVLACFTPERPLLGIAELAEQLDMSRPTTHRYVTTLVALGYLEQDESRKYRLRLGVTHLGLAALSATGLPTHARPSMEELSKRTGHTVDLAVLDGVESLLVERTRPERGPAGRSKQGPKVGSRQPAYCTSTGKVLLAYLPPAQQSKLISEMELIKLGPKTITAKRVLHEELQRVPKEGLAVADEELAAGACAIAAPVRADSEDVVAALSIVAHTDVIGADELVDELGGILIATAERISVRLGWQDGD